ncbi:transglycosylase SLT domain-containing protein [Agaribacter marinus]|uniref:Lytic transglycosylase n=1 Tax=Agaribacter marinus TaxID=1431249 RepID=A0AA37T279_9ALTE|nr:transglycosylase SLT domain-containing protein [Agaribacter marinus]GLR72540.1 lytic transglycosylase [Agaribacter marinus]
MFTREHCYRYLCLVVSLLIGFGISAQEAVTNTKIVDDLSTKDIDFVMNSAQRAEQREDFLRLERQVWKMSDKEFFKALTTMGDYPLVPYLEAKKLNHRMSLKKTKQIRAFLDEYENTPVGKQVRTPWLRYLLKRNRSSLFQEFYRSTTNAEMRCHFLRYQYKDLEDKSLVFSQVPELWNVGKSQPKACDPLFKIWMKAGQLTEDLVLHRIKKSAEGGAHTLIPYLKTLLPKDKQYLADLWHKTRRNPAFVKQLKAFTGKYPAVEAQVMTYGLSRLIWRDSKLALRTFEKAKNKLTFNAEQLGIISNKFAVSLAIERDKHAEDWLIKANEIAPDDETMRWHLAYLLRQQNWYKISLLIEKSLPQLTNENQFQYWLARAYEQIGKQGDAKALYKQLAENRDYYGFLASARLGIPHSLAHKSIDVDDRLVVKVLSSGEAKRAYELRRIEREYRARLEWLSMQRKLSDSEKLAAAVVSSEWGWHDQTIFTLGRMRSLDDVERRFPLAYADLLLPEAKKNNIQPEWSLAIARRESSFMPDAVSSANARGLMQILPSTAKYLEKRRVTSRELLNPKLNAKIGNKYLRYLMNKLDDNTLLATASYNAGWHKVRKWLPEKDAVDADIWVELIPYKETRNYVKAVMAYQQIYQGKLVASEPEISVFEAFVTSQVSPRT